MTASLWIPGPLPSLNQLLASAKGAGGTGRGYSRLKRQWTDTVWALAKRERLPRFIAGADLITFSWWERDCRRDPDNVAAGGRKMILDGLVQAKVLPGDGWAYVRNWRDDFQVAPKDGPPGPGVRVTLERA